MAERENHDVVEATYAFDTTGTVVLINAVAVGATAETRIGRQAHFDFVQIKGYVEPTSLAEVSKVDIYVIADAKPGAALPVMTDFFTVSSSLGFKNLGNSGRFHTLVHWTKVVGSLNVVADETYAQTPQVHNVDIAAAISVLTTFKGDNADLASIATGAIYLVTIGAQAPANGYTGQLSARVRYTSG